MLPRSRYRVSPAARYDTLALSGTRATGRKTPVRSVPPTGDGPIRRQVYRTMTGRTVHTAPPVVACGDFPFSWCLGAAMGRAWQPLVTFGARSAVLGGPGAPGGRVEVPGAGDAGAAVCLGGRGPGDAQPAAWAAAGVQLSGFGPVVDDAGAAAEPAGCLSDADLGAAAGRRAGDLVGVADPLDGFDVERAARAGEVSALGEQGDQVGVAGDGTEFADQPGGGAGRGGGHSGGPGPVDDDFIGGSGVPADPDPGLGPVGFG